MANEPVPFMAASNNKARRTSLMDELIDLRMVANPVESLMGRLSNTNIPNNRVNFRGITLSNRFEFISLTGYQFPGGMLRVDRNWLEW
jgi:hypothetical protein